jgi:PAS domain-containing protein
MLRRAAGDQSFKGSSRASEQSVSGQEPRFREPMTIWLIGRDAQCGNVNRHWREFRGRTAEQELEVGWTEGVHPGDLDQLMIAYRSAFEARSPLQLRFRFRRTDDSYVCVAAEGVPKFLADGNLAGYVCALTEIQTADSDDGSTGSSHIQSTVPDSAQLEGQQPRNRGFDSPQELLRHLNAPADPVVVLDSRGRAVYCNEEFLALAVKAPPSGASGGAAMGDPRAKGRALARAESLCSDRAIDCVAEVQAWLSSVSDFRNMRVSAEPITVGGERMIAFSILDTTEASAGRTLGRAFLHDLLNAVGGIQMLIDLLMEGASRKEQIEYVRLLQLSMNRLLSQIDARRMMLQDTTPMQSVCNVHDVLEEVLSRHRRHPIASPTRIRYVVNVPESAMALCDGRYLVGVLDDMMRKVIEDTSEGVVELECRLIDTEFEFRFKRAFSPKRISKGGRTRGFNSVSEQQKGNAMVPSDVVSIRYPAANASDIASSRAPSSNEKYAS